jgi:hypothetical protein
VRYSALAWGLLLVSNLLLADDEVESLGTQSLGTESLDTEFLEFLGLWETDQGEWLPPTEFAELQLDEDEDEDEEKTNEVVDEE